MRVATTTTCICVFVVLFSLYAKSRTHTLQNLDNTDVYYKIDAHYGKIQGTTSNRKSARPLAAELRQEVA